MDINYLGHSSFRLKGKGATVVTDPFDKEVGLEWGSVTAEIVTVSHDHSDHNRVDRVKGTQAKAEPLVIDAPGEYEALGVSVFGISSFHDKEKGATRGNNTIFTIHIDDVVVAHLGDLGDTLTKKQVELINGVDVLLLPVGGIYTIDPAEAVKVAVQVEPAIVVPMHFRAKGMGEAFAKLASLDDFLKEAGADGARREKKLTISKASLPESQEIVVLW